MSFRAIHQLVPFLSRGDAIGNHVLALQGLFKSWGYDSEIFTPGWHASAAGIGKPYRDFVKVSHPDNLLLYHYGIGGELTDFALGLPDRLVLYYHNITPAHFLYPFHGEMALHLEDGRRDLARFAGRTPAIAGSAYNGRELQALGFQLS